MNICVMPIFTNILLKLYQLCKHVVEYQFGIKFNQQSRGNDLISVSTY